MGDLWELFGCGLCDGYFGYFKPQSVHSFQCTYWRLGCFFDRYAACLGWFWNLEEAWECLLDHILFRGCMDK